MAIKPKYLTAQQVRELGILQEVNRQFFHPLGLALDVLVDPSTGETTGLGGVQDHRDSNGGVIFPPELLNTDKAKTVREMLAKNAKVRQERFNGTVVQPIE